MSTPDQKFRYLDFARGYAILTIVLYHALQKAILPPLLTQGIKLGGTGVHLFFLLSGFGLAWSGTILTAGAFYRRRLIKVWLPYVLALTISLLAAFCFDLFPDRWAAWLAGIGLYQMFHEPYIESFGGHFWFISTIVQFYLLFPVLKAVQRKIDDNRWFFTLGLIISISWWLIVYSLGKGELRIWNSCCFQFLWEFILGMALADALRKQSSSLAIWLNKAEKYWWVFLPIGVVFTGLTSWMIMHLGEVGHIFNDMPALIGYTALSIFIYYLSAHFFPLLNRFFYWVNGFSFSLYLIHVLVLDGLIRLFPAAWIWVSLAIYIPLVWLAGWSFEQLSRRWVGLFTTEARNRL